MTSRLGDYVIVHAGFAITRLDVEEAEKPWRCSMRLPHLGPTDALHPRLP
jgi:hydrogenase maturation factor